MVLQATQCMLVVMVQHDHVWWHDPCTRLLAPDGSCCTLIYHSIDRARRYLRSGATCIKFDSIAVMPDIYCMDCLGNVPVAQMYYVLLSHAGFYPIGSLITAWVMPLQCASCDNNTMYDRCTPSPQAAAGLNRPWAAKGCCRRHSETGNAVCMNMGTPKLNHLLSLHLQWRASSCMLHRFAGSV